MQLIGDPDLGFSGLRQFGTSLINSVTMKVGSAHDAPDEAPGHHLHLAPQPARMCIIHAWAMHVRVCAPSRCLPLLARTLLPANNCNAYHTPLVQVRKDLNLKNIMLVDSPGMIDSPVNSGIGALRVSRVRSSFMTWGGESAGGGWLLFVECPW